MSQSAVLRRSQVPAGVRARTAASAAAYVPKAPLKQHTSLRRRVIVRADGAPAGSQGGLDNAQEDQAAAQRKAERERKAKKKALKIDRKRKRLLRMLFKIMGELGLLVLLLTTFPPLGGPDGQISIPQLLALAPGFELMAMVRKMIRIVLELLTMDI